MAGGEGSRLRPLTCDCPKPMLRLMDKPLMEHAVRLLQRYGIHEIGVTLGYLPDAVMDYFGDGERFGTRLQYYIERTPLGTAGSVKQAEDFLDERFIVLSGDGITDCNLSAALRFHEENRALATLILQKSANPQEYGMVVTDRNGRIRSFHEKPGRSDVYSDLINTGIYILEPEVLGYIPENRPYDFGHDLFPALLRMNAQVCGFTAEGYWCDVGDVAAYLRVHADALEGRIHLPGMQPCADGAQLEPGCMLENPVYIAPGAHICPGAHIGAYSVIGENSVVDSGTSIKRSILFPGAHVGRNAQLRGCIVGTNAVAEEAAQLFEESVVGSASRVGERASLLPGVKLWPGKFLPGGERPDANIVWGSGREHRFIGGALQVESPAQATRAAQACAVGLKLRELVLARGLSSVSDAMWHAAAAGAMAQGVQVLDAGICSLPQLRHALRGMHSDGAMLAEEGRLIPLDARGARLTERSQRDILKLLERQDFEAPFHRITRPIRPLGETRLAYTADAAAMFRSDARCAPRAALCAEPLVSELGEEIFRRAGISLRHVELSDVLRPESGEIGITIQNCSEIAEIQGETGPLDEIQRQLACAWTALELGERRLLLPIHATRAVDSLAQRYGAHAVYLPGEDAAWMHALAGESPLQFQLQFDGLRFVLAFLSLLTEKGLSLDQWRRQMPAAWRSVRQVQVPACDCGRLLHCIAESSESAELGGGVRLPGGKGWTWLCPDDGGSRMNIFTESAEMEAARELCDFYGNEIQRLLGRRD